MNKKDLENFKSKLIAEKTSIEQELATLGKRDSSAPGGWEATPGDIQVDTADENELADKLEELEDNNGIMNQLENQLTEIKEALVRMEEGKYGNCETCGEPIEIERLEANPSAKISIKHNH